MTEAETAAPLLSRRAKEAIKLALALVITYACALAVDWDSAKWAGLAVVVVSLETVGQSLNKAAFRLAGTVVAMVVALALIGLFPQDRWLFLGALSLWISFCTYMTAGPRYQYAWLVAAFACTIICTTGGVDPANAFDTAMLRGQQTALGVIVYSLVSLLIWPVTSRDDFMAASRGLVSASSTVFSLSVSELRGKGAAEDVQAARAKLAGALTGYGPALDAAESDSREIGEQQDRWRRVGAQARNLATTMDLWRSGFTELHYEQLRQLLPGLDRFLEELGRRFRAMEDMVSGSPPAPPPGNVDLVVDEAALAASTHLDRAAAVIARDRLMRIESLTRGLHVDLAVIRGAPEGAAIDPVARPMTPPLSIDPDRLGGALRAMVGMWLGYFALIFVEGVPGGAGFLAILCPFIMFMAAMPQFPVAKLVVPCSVGIVIGAVGYLLVMPKLAGFLGLGTMVFAVIFAISYFFSEPQHMLGRVMGLAMFVAITAVDNQQTYSFMVVVNVAMMFGLVLLVIIVTAHVPRSSRPERAVMRLTSRFLGSCEYLAARPGDRAGAGAGWFGKARRRFHLREVATVPAKLGAWARFIRPDSLGDTSPAQVQRLIHDLTVLGDRVTEGLAMRPATRDESTAPEFEDSLASWRARLREALRDLASAPVVVRDREFADRLAQALDDAQANATSGLARTAAAQSLVPYGGVGYRLLGAYRGFSEALLSVAASAGAIDWQRWREERLA